MRRPEAFTLYDLSENSKREFEEWVNNSTKGPANPALRQRMKLEAERRAKKKRRGKKAPTVRELMRKSKHSQ